MAINTAFSHNALLEQELMLHEHINSLLVQLTWASHENVNVDIRKWFVFSIFDINSDYAFGEDTGCVANGSLHEWIQFVAEYFYAATLLHQRRKFAPLNWVLALCIPR